MKFAVQPLRGVNDILFGMNRDRVRELMGLPNTTIKRSKSEPAPFDHYWEYHMFCYYDADDNLNAVEFDSEADVSIFGIDTVSMNCEDIRSLFESRDYRTVKEDASSSFSVPAIAIAVTGGFSDATPDRDIESFYAGRAL